MTDELAELKADWRRQATDIEQLRNRLDGLRSRTRRRLLVQRISLSCGLLVGIAYAGLAWWWHDLLFALSALTLLADLYLFSGPALRLRRRSLDFQDRTPEGTLRYAVTRQVLIIRYLRLMFASSASLAVLSVVTWGAVAAGWVRYPLLLIIFITAVWLLAAGISAFSASRQLRRARADLAYGEQMLASFLEARQADLAGTTDGAPRPEDATKS